MQARKKRSLFQGILIMADFEMQKSEISGVFIDVPDSSRFGYDKEDAGVSLRSIPRYIMSYSGHPILLSIQGGRGNC